ncbi:DUF805 domain-containing protein [Maribius pontilimi]|uniref:DUF805 domain-containing protein n=1 Tax=Palleronia pontilimi TaxID=1964209 RepID=A0A934IJ72_9RHOB|nr:DUF805 domain-containing protein [Palleronia pontilimi]MBJ3763916.1 DUF805 domain-containing protein [Palleronia pontilimi]
MTPAAAIRTCLSKYATFSGRASRSEYWWFFLAYFLCGLVVGIIGKWAQLIYVALVIVPLTAAGARRLQDTGRPGWYIFVPLGVMLLFAWIAPAANLTGEDSGAQVVDTGSVLLAGILLVVQLIVAVVFLYWLTRPSERGPNAYGPSPDLGAVA